MGAFASFGRLTALKASRSLTTTEGKQMRTVAPVSPGEMLEEEFLKPLGVRPSTPKTLTPCVRVLTLGANSSAKSCLSVLQTTQSRPPSGGATIPLADR